MSKKEYWLSEIETARGLAIIAVLLIHITGQPVQLLQQGTLGHYFYVIINRCMQFSVPLFIMISALILAYRYQKSGSSDWVGFYRNRWRQVVVPYLIWTTFYILVVRFLLLGDQNYLSIKHWAFWYFLGKGYFHLYFLAVIIQFHLIFPLLLWVWKAINPNFIVSCFLFGALQIALYWVNRIYIYGHFPYPGSLIISYIFPIGIGFWLGWNVKLWNLWWKVYQPFVLLTAIAAGVYYVQQFSASLAGIKIDTFVFQVIWHLYVVAAGLAVLFAARSLESRSGTSWVYINKFLHKAGELSFGIYLVHPFFLLIWQKAWALLGIDSIHLSVWGGLLFISVCSWLVIKYISKFHFGKILLGNR